MGVDSGKEAPSSKIWDYLRHVYNSLNSPYVFYPSLITGGALCGWYIIYKKDVIIESIANTLQDIDSGSEIGQEILIQKPFSHLMKHLQLADIIQLIYLLPSPQNSTTKYFNPFTTIDECMTLKYKDKQNQNFFTVIPPGSQSWLLNNISSLPNSPEIDVQISPINLDLFSIFSKLLILFSTLRIGKYYLSELLTFNKSTNFSIYNDSTSKVKFKDIVGMNELKTEFQQIIDMVYNPVQYNSFGVRIPHGYLLSGPSGTGKTLMAKALAGESGLPFFYASGSSFIELFVGHGARRIRDLFNHARQYRPCIIFIDELDAIGTSRGDNEFSESSSHELTQTLNQLLVEMDGFGTHDENTYEDCKDNDTLEDDVKSSLISKSKFSWFWPNDNDKKDKTKEKKSFKTDSIIIIAATNRIRTLDKALTRPGRFDRIIQFNFPNDSERHQLLLHHSRRKPISPTFNYIECTKNTTNMSGAGIESLLNDAALIALRNKSQFIETKHFNEALRHSNINYSPI